MMKDIHNTTGCVITFKTYSWYLEEICENYHSNEDDKEDIKLAMSTGLIDNFLNNNNIKITIHRVYPKRDC